MNNPISKVHIAYHRNEVSGNGFHVITFHNKEDNIDMVSVIFEEKGNIAVFNQELLGKGQIDFAVNSWRGDYFEPFLRKAIAKWDKKES